MTRPAHPCARTLQAPIRRGECSPRWQRSTKVWAVVGAVLLVWFWPGEGDGPSASLTGQHQSTTHTALAHGVQGIVPMALPDAEASRVSPFGAVTAPSLGPAPGTTPTDQFTQSHQTSAKWPARQADAAPEIIAAGAVVATASDVASAWGHEQGSGPPPRSDRRYQAATTWRRVMPH